jgi:hypothetical protein
MIITPPFGGSGINHAAEIWCSEKSLPFTRSRGHRRRRLRVRRLSGFEEQALPAAVYTPRFPLLNAPCMAALCLLKSSKAKPE